MDRLLEAAGAALTTRRGNLPPGRFNEGNQQQFYYYEYVQESQHNRGFLYWCWRFLVTTFKLAILGLLSMGSYAVFYQLNQPVVLHFQRFQFDYYDTQPSATVVLNAKQNQWKPLLEGIEAISEETRILKPGQAYYVELALKLPESQFNIDSGMFGVTMDLYGSSNETSRLLATSRRSLRFPYRSSWVRAVANAVLLPTLLLRAMDEVKTVKDNVFRHVLEAERYELYAVVVKLLEPVEVVAAEVRVGEELTSFQELIRTWFWTCFMIGSNIFAAIYFAAYQIIMVWLSNAESLHEEPPCDLNFEEYSIHTNTNGNGLNSTSTNARPTEEGPQNSSPEVRTSPGHSRSTRQPPPDEVEIPDAFGDGSDGEWEDLSVTVNETHNITSEPSIHSRSMTSNDLRRYLNRTTESEAGHPFLVFMGD